MNEFHGCDCDLCRYDRRASVLWVTNRENAEIGKLVRRMEAFTLGEDEHICLWVGVNGHWRLTKSRFPGGELMSNGTLEETLREALQYIPDRSDEPSDWAKLALEARDGMADVRTP